MELVDNVYPPKAKGPELLDFYISENYNFLKVPFSLLLQLSFT